MPVEIPTRPDLVNYTTRVVLDAKRFDLDIAYNQRDDRYYLSIYDAATVANADGSRTAILAGIALVVATPLLGQFRDRARPLGDMVVIDSRDPQQDPKRGELGDRVRLYYMTRAELVGPNYLYALPLGAQ